MSAVTVNNAFRDVSLGDAKEAPPPAEAAAPAAPKPGRCQCSAWSRTGSIATLKAANVCNGIILALFAILLLVPLAGTSDLIATSSSPFAIGTLACYVVFCGIILCCVEIPMPCCQQRLRGRCGIFRTYSGRVLFLILCVLGSWLGPVRAARQPTPPNHLGCGAPSRARQLGEHGLVLLSGIPYRRRRALLESLIRASLHAL